MYKETDENGQYQLDCRLSSERHRNPERSRTVTRDTASSPKQCAS